MNRKIICALLFGSMFLLSACRSDATSVMASESGSISETDIETDKEEGSTEEASLDALKVKRSKKGSETGKKDKSSADKNTENTGATRLSETSTLKDGENLSGKTFTATESDVSAVEISGDITASISDSTIEKSRGDATSADDSSFKGVNAAVRVSGSASLTITDSKIRADAQNATGVFAYDQGIITISDSSVDVTGGGSGGIQVAGGGTLYANNLTVTSASKAAIRSDRGGGTLVVDGGTYTSTGSGGCPAIYSTAEISVSRASCVSENSRAVIIEGKNSVTLDNCTLSGNDQSTKEGSIKANVLLYQSTSGDADEGTSEFTMNGGSMVSNSGAMFYCTNTSGIINLSEADLTLSNEGSLLIVSAGRWGKDGKNGGSCKFFASDQKLAGSITVDDISSLKLSLFGSVYEGAINEAGESGDVSVTLDENSTWTLTGDSYVSSFDGNVGNVVSNGYHLYVLGEAVL